MAKVNIPNRPGASKAQIKAERAVAKQLSKDPEISIVHRPLGLGPNGAVIPVDHFFVAIPGKGRFLIRVSIHPNNQPDDEREAAIASARLENQLTKELGYTPQIIPVVTYPNHNGPTFLDPQRSMPNLF